MKSQKKIAVIGLGAMGYALAATLVSKGEKVIVWNRTADKARDLVNQGVEEAVSLAAAVNVADIIILCLLDNEVVRQQIEPTLPALAGKIVVNLTNGTPAHALELFELVTAQKGAYLDGGIMAVPPMIGLPGSLILYAGDALAFETAKPVLEKLGSASYLGEDAGLAALYDLALLSGMYGMFAGFIQSAALMVNKGIKVQSFLTYLVPWLQAMVTTLPNMADQIDSGDYGKNVVSNLGMQAAAYENIVSVTKSEGIDPVLVDPLRTLFASAMQLGHGYDDLSRLVEIIVTNKF